MGMTAFSRIIPASFLNTYHIVALHKTGDLPLLRKKSTVFCLEEETGAATPAPGQNSADLLAHPQTMGFLKGLPNPKYLFLYQNYPELSASAKKNGWNLLANSPQLRQAVGKRRFFKDMVASLGLAQIPGNIYAIRHLHEKRYEEWAHGVGPNFVVQLPDIERGGGRGTFFIRSMEDYHQLQERLAGNRWRNTPLASVSIHRFVEGTPASTVACVTRHGILTSSLQRQLLDLPYCQNFEEDGVFCGHAWGLPRWSKAVRKSAFEQAYQIGSFLGRMGYKGILGIDFIVHEGREKVYPIEINPRLTGALPMLSQLHLQADTIPLEAFHILEFLGLPYQIDPEALNRRYVEPVQGSHLLLFRPPGAKTNITPPLKAGLYEYEPKGGAFQFLKETLEYRCIQSERQFILSDGPRQVESNGVPDSHGRLCRLLFSYPVVDEKGTLSPPAFSAAKWVSENAALIIVPATRQ